MYFRRRNMVFWQQDGRRGGLFMGKETEKVAVGFMGIQIAIAAAKLAGNSVKVYDVRQDGDVTTAEVRIDRKDGW
jgi:hypothetical protein